VSKRISCIILIVMDLVLLIVSFAADVEVRNREFCNKT